MDRTATITPAPPPTTPPLLDVAALATRLGVKVRFVRRLVDERRIPYLKVGRLVRFDPLEVERWIGAARVPLARLSAGVGRTRGAM
jgi:excisionase family DNA binding protein